MKPLLYLLSISFICLGIHFNLIPKAPNRSLFQMPGMASSGRIQVLTIRMYNSSGVSATAEYRLYIHIANIGEIIYYGFGNPLNMNDGTVARCYLPYKNPFRNHCRRTCFNTSFRNRTYLHICGSGCRTFWLLPGIRLYCIILYTSGRYRGLFY